MHWLTGWLMGVLAKVRNADPSTYLRVLFTIIPKDVTVSIEQRSGPMDRNHGNHR